MKALKMTLLSFSVGVVLSIIPMAVYAACDATMSYRDMNNCHLIHDCDLVGESCSANVCVCAYNCGPVGSGRLDDGPCPEGGLGGN